MLLRGKDVKSYLFNFTSKLCLLLTLQFVLTHVRGSVLCSEISTIRDKVPEDLKFKFKEMKAIDGLGFHKSKLFEYT